MNRADVEWLLATHENGLGPVRWDESSQRDRQGLDLRGANLRNVNLSHLPLDCIWGGGILKRELTEQETIKPKEIHPEEVHLEGANLTNTFLRGAILISSHLENADLQDANLRGAILISSHLENANLQDANLHESDLEGAHLERANLHGANLRESSFKGAHLERANLNVAILEKTNFNYAHFEGAIFIGSTLNDVQLIGAHLEGAILFATIIKANLQEAFFDGTTDLRGLCFGEKRGNDYFSRMESSNRYYVEHQGRSLWIPLTFDPKREKMGEIYIADVHWNDVNVAVVNWSEISKLGEENTAIQLKDVLGRIKSKAVQGGEYSRAARAYRQLSIVLGSQGLNDDAARFAYRAQLMERNAFRYQGKRKMGQYFFSLFLDLLAGYGYKPWRSFLAYLVVIVIFAALYYHLGAHLLWNEAIVISMTAFHGRGFFPEQFHPGDPQALIAAIEAFVGLLIEVTFIATLTQRLFNK